MRLPRRPVGLTDRCMIIDKNVLSLGMFLTLNCCWVIIFLQDDSHAPCHSEIVYRFWMISTRNFLTYYRIPMVIVTTDYQMVWCAVLANTKWYPLSYFLSSGSAYVFTNAVDCFASPCTWRSANMYACLSAWGPFWDRCLELCVASVEQSVSALRV